MRSSRDTQEIKYKECQTGWHMPELHAIPVLMRLRQEDGCKFEANLCFRIDPVSNRTKPQKSIHTNIKVTHQAYFFKISLCVHVRDFSTRVNKQTQTGMTVLHLLFPWLVIFGHFKLYSEVLYFENGFARTIGTLITHFLNAFVLFSLVRCSKCWISYPWLRALLRNFTLRAGDPVSKGLATQMEDSSCDPQHCLAGTHLKPQCWEGKQRWIPRDFGQPINPKWWGPGWKRDLSSKTKGGECLNSNLHTQTRLQHAHIHTIKFFN